MKTEDSGTCPSCGNEFSGAMAFLFCTLRKALAAGVRCGKTVTGSGSRFDWSMLEETTRSRPKAMVENRDIAKTVAAILSAHLSPHKRKDIEEIPNNDQDAYDLCLQAKELLARPPGIRTSNDDLLKAVDLLEEATRKDSQFDLAYCLLARAQGDLYLACTTYIDPPRSPSGGVDKMSRNGSKPRSEKSRIY